MGPWTCLAPYWRGDSAKQEPREEVARPAQPLGHAPSSKLKPHALDASTWPGGGPGTDQTPLLPPRFAIPVPAPAESCGAPSSRYLLALLVTGGQPPAVARQAGGPSSAMNSGCSLTNEESLRRHLVYLTPTIRERSASRSTSASSTTAHRCRGVRFVGAVSLRCLLPVQWDQLDQG